MDVQRDRRDLEGGVLGLPRPDQLRVKVRIVGVVFLPASLSVSGVTRPTGGLFSRSRPVWT
jgi:hypothetical protein